MTYKRSIFNRLLIILSIMLQVLLKSILILSKKSMKFLYYIYIYILLYNIFRVLEIFLSLLREIYLAYLYFEKSIRRARILCNEVNHAFSTPFLDVSKYLIRTLDSYPSRSIDTYLIDHHIVTIRKIRLFLQP